MGKALCTFFVSLRKGLRAIGPSLGGHFYQSVIKKLDFFSWGTGKGKVYTQAVVEQKLMVVLL